jgi:hypothetical protein
VAEGGPAKHRSAAPPDVIGVQKIVNFYARDPFIANRLVPPSAMERPAFWRIPRNRPDPDDVPYFSIKCKGSKNKVGVCVPLVGSKKHSSGQLFVINELEYTFSECVYTFFVWKAKVDGQGEDIKHLAVHWLEETLCVCLSEFMSVFFSK